MRNRAWRRAQALRLIERRRRLARALWGWSYRERPDWIEEQAVHWDKVNPFTQCSCWMCQFSRRGPDYDWRREEWE